MKATRNVGVADDGAEPDDHDVTIPILSEARVRRVISVNDALEEIRAAYAEYGRQRQVLSTPPALNIIPPSPHAAFKVKGAHLAERGVTGCRLIADAVRDGQEMTTDYCWVADSITGEPLGMVSEAWLHRLRTAGTGVVAAQLMARTDSRIAVIIGAGRIAEELPDLLNAAFDLSEIRVYARRMSSAEAFAARHTGAVPVRAFDDIDAAVDGTDLVMAISAAETPVLHARHMAPGRFMCGMGGGAEIAIEAMDCADRFVVDDMDYACMIGSVRGWLDAGTDHDRIVARLDADIGEIATGQKPQRKAPSDAILAIIQGMACCDLALAHLALKRAGIIAPVQDPTAEGKV